MSERQGRTLRDDVRESANKIFQKWKKKPNKSVHVETSTRGAAITTRPGAAGPSGLISQAHHDQGSSSVSKSTQGKTSYSRLCRLLISIGSRVLRDTFDNIIPPENLRELLKRDPAHSRLQLLRKKGVLSSVHWSKLYPATPTEVSSASFDIPLLIVLLRTICNLSPPPSGWDTPPLTADTSRESDITRIKYFMNAVSKHAAEGSVSDAVFNSYWQQIRDTLVRLGGADFEDTITEMKHQEMDPLDEEHFKEILKQWRKIEDDIKDKLNEVELEKAAKRADFSHPTNITEKICHLYRTREKRLLPVPWLEDFSFHMNDIFTRLKIVGKEKTQGGLTDDITNMTAIFKVHAECQRPRTVLIEGDPGMGKTTYCQKLAYDWATKQGDWDSSFPEIEVLLFLKCHEIKSDIWEAIDDQLLPEEMDDQAKKRFFKFIRENQSKVLLVLDGLDEADPRNRKMFFNLVQGKELSDCFIVLTARHEAGREVRRYCDTLWEIVGFTKEDAKSFIQKYFKNIHKEDLARTLIEMVCPLPRSVSSGVTKALEGLTKNPLNTTLLCVMWEDFEGVFPKSRTRLYIEIVLCVLRRYERKQGLSSENEDLLTVYKEDLLYLGGMALQSLRKGEFYFEEHKSDLRLIALSKFGFLSLQAANNKREVRVRYAFLHKSFQEFFSGFYLACKLVEGDIDCESVVTDRRYYYELKQVFLFFIEILASKSEETSESLVKSMALNINSIQLNSISSLKSATDVSNRVLFALSCLSEYPSLLRTLGKHLNFTYLYLSDGVLNEEYDCDDGDGDDDDGFVLLSFRFKAPPLGNSDAASVSQVLKANSSLTSLDLSGNAIRQSGASCLSDALIANSSLTSLCLSGNEIGDDGASCLSQALIANSSLTTLDLSRCSISQSGASCLSHALEANSSLRYFDLSQNSIGENGAACLTQALKANCCLTNVDLSENGISESGASFFSQVLLGNSSLTRLCLRRNGVGVDAASCLSKALAANSSLTSFDLSWNSIGEDGAACLSQALAATSSLSYLGLSGNIIGDNGAVCLSQALAANSSLSNLDLCGNRIGDDGAASLSEALKVNFFLTNLDLGWNSIGEDGAACLSQALSVNSSLTYLDLSCNSIGVGGAVCLSQALATNSSLINLDLSGNGIGDDGAASLFRALTANSSLTNLNLSSNFICESVTSCLVQAFPAISLTSLDLSVNRIGDDGAVWLSKALVANSSLTYLNLRSNPIGVSGHAALIKRKKLNKTVKVKM